MSSDSAPKRKGGAEKLRDKKKKCLEEGASKHLKISNFFGKPPTGDSEKVRCSVDLAKCELSICR